MANLPMPDGLTTKDLECVMIDVETLDIERAMGEDWDEDDLFYGDIPELTYAQGAVAEESAHLTLLFGIHPSPDYEMSVHLALENWDLPPILIERVGFFPSRIEGQDYVCVVAHVVKSAALVAGNRRLAVLPHTNEYTYHPHITLVYLKGSADKDKWIDRLASEFAYKMVEPLRLNLGLDDD